MRIARSVIDFVEGYLKLVDMSQARPPLEDFRVEKFAAPIRETVLLLLDPFVPGDDPETSPRFC